MTRLLRLEDAAERLGLTRSGLKHRIQRGTIDLPVIPLGNAKRPSLRVRESDLDALVDGLSLRAQSLQSERSKAS